MKNCWKNAFKKEIINREIFKTHKNIVGAGLRKDAGHTMASIDLPNTPDGKVFQNGDEYQIGAGQVYEIWDLPARIFGPAPTLDKLNEPHVVLGLL